jgi:hypothetical protein
MFDKILYFLCDMFVDSTEEQIELLYGTSMGIKYNPKVMCGVVGEELYTV